MGLAQTLMYTLLPIAGVIFFLLGNTTGYNFALKVNLIANFFAPMLAYNIAQIFGIAFIITPTKNFIFEFIFILIITFMIIYLIAVLSIYKAATGDLMNVDKDETNINTVKTSCSSYKISSAMKHGLKIAFAGIITFFTVANMPSLQKPFIRLA